MGQEMSIDCGILPDLISVGEIIALNRRVTEPEDFDEEVFEEGLEGSGIGGPNFEVAREEDYHQLNSKGILETLVETILPMECRQSNEVIWLTTVLMAEIAQNQAFYEGNKRTAYITGTVFLVRCQLLEDDEAIYPILDREFTDKLAELAIGNTSDKGMDRQQFYEYLKERLS